MIKTHQINIHLQLRLPDCYKRLPLTGKKSWCEALMSGEYHKVASTLCRENEDKTCEYCCLGVFSRLQGRLNREGNQFFDGQEDLDVRVYGRLEINNPALNDGFNQLGLLPKAAEILLMRVDEGGLFTQWLEALGITTLADLNDARDGQLCNFTDIAKVIDLVWYDAEHEQP